MEVIPKGTDRLHDAAVVKMTITFAPWRDPWTIA
jgi:hypothetical protein